MFNRKKMKQIAARLDGEPQYAGRPAPTRESALQEYEASLLQLRRAAARVPRQRLECASAPTSRCAFLPHPQCSGGSGSSSQSHWVSSPGGCSIGAFARPFVAEQGSQCGRRPLARSWRVKVGYDRS